MSPTEVRPRPLAPEKVSTHEQGEGVEVRPGIPWLGIAALASMAVIALAAELLAAFLAEGFCFLGGGRGVLGAPVLFLLLAPPIFLVLWLVLRLLPALRQGFSRRVHLDEGGLRVKQGRHHAYWSRDLVGCPRKVDAKGSRSARLEVLDSANGLIVSFPLFSLHAQSQADKLVSALMLPRCEHTARLPIHRLRQNQRSVDAWLEDIREDVGSSKHPSAYRSALGDSEALLDAARNPELAADVRAGAAYGLLSLEQPELDRQLHQALHKASPPLLLVLAWLMRGDGFVYAPWIQRAIPYVDDDLRDMALKMKRAGKGS